MITKDKIHIYKSYGGDVDGWARVGSKEEKELMNDEDWFLIEDLLQDISLQNSGNSSKEYSIKIDEKLKEKCSDEEAIKQLKELAE
jgi:hypothetical protein